MNKENQINKWKKKIALRIYLQTEFSNIKLGDRLYMIVW